MEKLKALEFLNHKLNFLSAQLKPGTKDTDFIVFINKSIFKITEAIEELENLQNRTCDNCNKWEPK